MKRADRVFTAMLGLALASSAILLALLLTLAPRVEQLAARGAEDTADIVAAVVLLLAVCGISLGLVTLFRQLLATAVLIRGLVAQKIALPSTVVAAASGLDLDGRIDVVADERPFSFCYWFLRPRICLSSALVERLDADELRAVLYHERYHLRQRDPLRQVVARYFAAGLYVVPVVDELLAFHTLQKEIEADQDAVRASGGVRSLASALYKLLPDADDVSLGLLVPVSSLSVTEARIDQLVAGRPLSIALSPLSVVLSGGALVAAAVLVAVKGGASVAFETLPPLYAVPGLLVGPASLLFAAAVDGGLHQLRPLTQRLFTQST
ncbi:MAG TPA: M56 family metallopeptidase [Candidatus Udaeobacter sp.]|nr:M56 family metallopeptidase [Candidatus Udaeobacter sp.]